MTWFCSFWLAPMLMALLSFLISRASLISLHDHEVLTDVLEFFNARDIESGLVHLYYRFDFGFSNGERVL